MEALIALGSNIDKAANLSRARVALSSHPAIDLLAVSPIHVTAAIAADGSQSNQPVFYNAAARIATSLDAARLHEVLRSIEAQLGRERSADKFAPRPIDLDLAYFGSAAVTFDNKTIPDADVLRYAHVAVPLAAVAPTWVHPVTGQTLAAIAQRWAYQAMESLSWTSI
jgi:2-amino-4-hydroxy-6-hydroxymethyldihydropteridine diphosphokinase